jgi:hypothetical protein
MITVEATAAGVRVTIPKDDMPPERLSSFLEWLRLESIVRSGNLAESDADRFADGIKADWWQANKSRLTEPARP